jgi:hypothetical protein
VTDLLDWLGHWPADEVSPNALAALRDGVDWIVQGLPVEQRRRLASLATGSAADEPVADNLDAALLKVVVGLLIDITWWLEACSDEEIDPDTAVKLLESTCVVTELPGDLPARLVEVIAELANAEQSPARRHVLEAVPFWTGLVEDDPEDDRPVGAWVHPAARLGQTPLA